MTSSGVRSFCFSSNLRILCRTFSSTASCHQLVKTPTQVFGTEGRYASALYSAATKNKALDAVEKDLKSFQETLKKDKRLAEFLADPSVKKNVKIDGLAGACDKLKLNPLTKNLFTMLAENGRHNLFDSVISSFGTIMAAHRGEVVCEVVTAKVGIPFCQTVLRLRSKIDKQPAGLVEATTSQSVH